MIIGRNGSGKSTLLKMVSGLLQPSQGSLTIRGRTAALIELGAGFNPEFTGRENVMLSGLMYGLPAGEMSQVLADVIEFSELQDFIDQPVKTYSSGMYARLAFSVAIQVRPEILIVDEILSVGDLDFQARCVSRIEKMRAEGTAIFFVSHDLNTVQTLCTRCMLLDHGKQISIGEPSKVIDDYLGMLGTESHRKAGRLGNDPGGLVQMRSIALLDDEGRDTAHARMGKRYRLRYTLYFRDRVERPVVSMLVRTMNNEIAYDQTSRQVGLDIPEFDGDCELTFEHELDVNLCPNGYRIGIGVAERRGEQIAPVFGSDDFAFEVLSDRPASGIAALDAKMRLVTS